MVQFIPPAFCSGRSHQWFLSLAIPIALACSAVVAQAGDRSQPPTNVFGAPVIDQNRKPINYDQAAIEKMASKAATQRPTTSAAATRSSALNSSFVPPSGAQLPFWQYAIFGSGIGASNIVIAPTSSGPRQIILGGSSKGYFFGNDFWQVLRWNSTSQQYEQVFVSPIYSATINRIALGDVVGDANPEIVVMLDDGRIYLYDLATNAELGHIETGLNSPQGLCLKDLQDDAHAELIVTTANDLFVFNGTGTLLWSVLGVGGQDVVAGQMDNDPAIEIATTSGHVIDASTHTVKWTRTSGFGRSLRLAPFPGEAYQQLIVAESWYYVYAYDIARQLPRWSIHTQQDIGGIEVANVDGDATPELLIGDGQWGKIHVYDLLTQTEKWAVSNPEHGVTNIAVGDVDGDGTLDLLWGAGYSDTGPDHLYVADTSTHSIKWKSVDLEGPFVGPVIGDLDGDGKLELVVCSRQSDATYSSGRILVFDLATLSLRGMSAPVMNNQCWTGVRDLKLRDIDGDGHMEIIIGGDNLYDGAIEAYGFDSSNVFTRKWANTTRPSGSPFNFVDVADLNGNGTVEIIGGNTIATTGSEGSYVYIYDYPSGANPWRSVNLQAGGGVTGMLVRDLDHNSSKEIAALVQSGDLYTFDGPSRTLRNLLQSTGFTLLSTIATDFGFVGGDNTGTGHYLQYANDHYFEPFSCSLGTTALDGINEFPDGFLWTGEGGVLTLRMSPYRMPTWQSPVFDSGFGRFIATDMRNGQPCVFSSALHAVAGFTYTTQPFQLDIIAPRAKGNDIVITYSAVAGKTFRLERKLPPNGDWQTLSGSPDQTPTRNGPAQFIDYGAISLRKAFYRITQLP